MSTEGQSLPCRGRKPGRPSGEKEQAGQVALHIGTPLPGQDHGACVRELMMVLTKNLELREHIEDSVLLLEVIRSLQRALSKKKISNLLQREDRSLEKSHLD